MSETDHAKRFVYGMIGLTALLIPAILLSQWPVLFLGFVGLVVVGFSLAYAFGVVLDALGVI